MKFVYFFNVWEKEKEPKMVLNPCYVVVDKDGDFVDACSGRMPPHTLSGVVERMVKEFPENVPFRILHWTGVNFVEVVPLM